MSSLRLDSSAHSADATISIVPVKAHDLDHAAAEGPEEDGVEVALVIADARGDGDFERGAAHVAQAAALRGVGKIVLTRMALELL